MVPIIFKDVNEGEGPMDLVATHQRLLVGAALRTTGPILELGCGWYSTPLLHEVAVTQNRPLVTLDDQDDWLQQFAARDWPARTGFKNGRHRLVHVPNWEDAALHPQAYGVAEPYWGLCFVDHGPPIERYYVVKRVLRQSWCPRVFVFHDTEERRAYGYDRLLKDGTFRYVWTDKCQKAHTTVASDYERVDEWFRELPPVAEPPKEVT